MVKNLPYVFFWLGAGGVRAISTLSWQNAPYKIGDLIVDMTVERTWDSAVFKQTSRKAPLVLKLPARKFLEAL